MLNKKAVIVASSLGAIPLTALLIAIVSRRAMHRSLQRTKLLKQTRLESNTLININTPTNSQQQNEEESQSQSESLRQALETVVEATTNTTDTTTAPTSISANVLNSDKDIVVPVALSVVVSSSPTDPSSSTVSPIVASPSQSAKEQEISFNDEARKAGESLKEWIAAAIKDAKDSAKGTGKRLKEETIGSAAPTDSKDIQSLEDTLNALVGFFEKTMIEIRKEGYDEQIKLLQSYKDLLQTQIKVVRARGTMARKLKPGA